MAPRVVAATGRPLTRKPCPKTLQEWVDMAAKAYPHNDWRVRSRFPWEIAHASWELARQYVTTNSDDDNKFARPDTDIAVCAATRLECKAVVHLKGVAAFDDGKWTRVSKIEGLQDVGQLTRPPRG